MAVDNLERKKWEKTHKPTCNFYPCYMWREIHWHIGCKHKTNRWDKCKFCRQKYDRLKTLKGDKK